MKTTGKLLGRLFSRLFYTALLSAPLVAAEAPRPANGPRDLNTPRTFPEITSRAEWQKRAAEIREHVLFANGLMPMLDRTPLNDRVFDRVERDGYSIEKVYLETYPGFYLAGNLYRPLGKGDGPFPAILNPHGHWKNGRMADEDLGSIAARCISFARQGMIAFTYDMVGYNDTVQVDHTFASEPSALLWNISLMGLQTWNSIRALDFLESLPDVDRKRLACTGESGGGTQTFILGAIDPRLAAQAPIVMVSHSMQGGCLCENAPGLRVDYSNMEIAAAVAPRPQVIVAATGDWTKKMMEVEGPAIEKIYSLFRAADRFDYAIFDYPHNYNKDTREAVYASFGRWLLNSRDTNQFKEKSYKKEADADLRVFPNDKLPSNALTEPQLIASLIRTYKQQIEDRQPINLRAQKLWKSEMQPAWEHAHHLQHISGSIPEVSGPNISMKRQPDGRRVEFSVRDSKAAGSRNSRKVAIILGAAEKNDLAERISAMGWTVVEIPQKRSATPDLFKSYYHTYNRTPVQDAVADVKVVSTYIRERFPRAELHLIGVGESGFAALCSAPLVDSIIADANGLDESSDEDLLAADRFFPGVRRLGSVQGILALDPPKSLFVHNFKSFTPLWIDNLFSSKHVRRIQTRAKPATDSELIAWLAEKE